MARVQAGAAFRGVLAIAAIAAGLGLGAVALAQAGGAGEGGAESYPLPGSAPEAYSPIGEGFESPIEPRADLKGPKPYVDEREARLKAARATPELNPFFRDTELAANSRTYWFDEDHFGFSQPRALTTGGYLSYQSGYLANFLQLRAALYTTQPLYATRGCRRNLEPDADGDQITVLGQANARVKFAGQELTIGRQLVRTPYINPFDVRMIPLTYEGVVLVPERYGQQPLDYIASYLWQYKPRNSASFVPLSEALGVEQDEGVLITGIRRRTESLNYGLVNYWINDAMNTLYGEVDYALPIAGGEGQPNFRVGVNDADQRSVGADLIPVRRSPPIRRRRGRCQLSRARGDEATSRVGDDAPLLKPFGSSASYTSMIISSFTRAGEAAMSRASPTICRVSVSRV